MRIRGSAPRGLPARCRAFLTVVALLGLVGAVPAEAPVSDPNSRTDILYRNVRNPNVPLSIHVVRVPRGKSPFEIQTAHAGGRAIGLGRLSDQTALLDTPTAKPVAAINGDYYVRGGRYAGAPRGLQIVAGELISAPSGGASFWIDALGEPHVTNTTSLLQVIWPDGQVTPIGLNGERGRTEIELYTTALGSSTQTSGGREFILEQQGKNPWLPLKPGRLYRAQVREIRQAGDTHILPGTMVLSVSPTLLGRIPRVQVGAELVISTATSPSLRGARAAISGGPVLLRDGKRQRIAPSDSESYVSRSMGERHPRSAIGWNDDYYYLVEVDGRARGLSVGLTLSELSSYLLELGCREAMALDGGGSATLWYNGRVQNRPCDGYERMIANSLVVLKRQETPAPSPPTAGAAATTSSP